MIYLDSGFYDKEKLNPLNTFCKTTASGDDSLSLRFELLNIEEHKIHFIESVSIPVSLPDNSSVNAIADFMKEVDEYLALIKVDFSFDENELRAIRQSSLNYAYCNIPM